LAATAIEGAVEGEFGEFGDFGAVRVHHEDVRVGGDDIAGSLTVLLVEVGPGEVRPSGFQGTEKRSFRSPRRRRTTVPTMTDSHTESLEEFAQSLSYGKRSDLSFKFLPRFDDPTLGDALASVLREVGAVFDSGNPADLIDLAISLQVDGYQAGPLAERYRYDDGPFNRPERPVAESRVVLLTSSGHFAADDDPRPLGVESMTQIEAEERISEFLKEAPTLSEISASSTGDLLEVRHGGYDVRGSRADHNVSFPIDRLRELEEQGVIGNLHDTAYSFVGACAQTPLLKRTGPEWADRLKSTGSAVVLLVPV
jgi:hypothetical protein